MSRERAELMEWLRGELVGPGIALKEPEVVEFSGETFIDPKTERRGPLHWKPPGFAHSQEVLYFRQESPHRKYGVGCLHPEEVQKQSERMSIEDAASESASIDSDGVDEPESEGNPGDAKATEAAAESPEDASEAVGTAVFRPASMAISVAVRVESEGSIVVRLPSSVRFAWQHDGAPAIPVNGCYRRFKRSHAAVSGPQPVWARQCVIADEGFSWRVTRDQLDEGRIAPVSVAVSNGVPLNLSLEMYPRQVKGVPDQFIVTVVLRNRTSVKNTEAQAAKNPANILFQSYFDVSVDGGHITAYPENQRVFQDLDEEEQSLALLYREAATYGIGHGCAAGWDAAPGVAPSAVFADVFPAVELPSMTPDVLVDDAPLRISMRELMGLSEDGHGPGWDAIEQLVQGYSEWLVKLAERSKRLGSRLKPVASRHLEQCQAVLARLKGGVQLLRDDAQVRSAFRLANRAMLLQQIATKALRPGQGDKDFLDPLQVLAQSAEGPRLGYWRAFQAAFLLMSLRGVHDEADSDRGIVDVIWFPTGGGKTEAYLVVVAFVLILERLKMAEGGVPRDGTNVIMRYTLRMLTTQQFQRASALICAMEIMRRNPASHSEGALVGSRFSLGLWLGGDGAPNKIEEAKKAVANFQAGHVKGNPLVLTECPWCRASIGRHAGGRKGKADLSGIMVDKNEGPLLLCPKALCAFGRQKQEEWLPIEVIDERIYRRPPSLVIGTVDKFAMISFRPDSRALFGRAVHDGVVKRVAAPPVLIIQDELHLITAALGTMYAVYEPILHELCASEGAKGKSYPKIIASTATLRGASNQVRGLYGRTEVQVFPSPGLEMGDSFFGTYAKSKDGKLLPGRLYLGVEAENYGSVLTAQIRTFAALLARPWWFSNDKRDPWFTLLAFYNSIRELSGAKTLFDADIRSRLKNIFNREAETGQGADSRRHLRAAEELTSRLSQPEIVAMMDRLATPYGVDKNGALDACLATNIIEVGVDIDRLSLMSVVGQPKGSASYIQVTGRVGRRWDERPGLIVTIYNPSRSRDRSHYEQFHAYHRRLYERVEPTSVTPFAGAALERAAAGAMLAWVRQNSAADVNVHTEHCNRVNDAAEILKRRCLIIEHGAERDRALAFLDSIRDDLMRKWRDGIYNEWESYPQNPDHHYVMLWPGKYSTAAQRRRGSTVPSSMRHVDREAELAVGEEMA